MEDNNKLNLDDLKYIENNIEIQDMGKGSDEPEEEDNNGDE